MTKETREPCTVFPLNQAEAPQLEQVDERVDAGNGVVRTVDQAVVEIPSTKQGVGDSSHSVEEEDGGYFTVQLALPAWVIH